MHVDIEKRREEIAVLCRRFGVIRLEVFGSAARGTDFDPERSDADFLVEFAPDAATRTLTNFFAFQDALHAVLGRPVDLVELTAVRNPYVLAGINRTREVVYAP